MQANQDSMEQEAYQAKLRDNPRSRAKPPRPKPIKMQLVARQIIHKKGSLTETEIAHRSEAFLKEIRVISKFPYKGQAWCVLEKYNEDRKTRKSISRKMLECQV